MLELHVLDEHLGQIRVLARTLSKAVDRLQSCELSMNRTDRPARRDQRQAPRRRGYPSPPAGSFRSVCSSVGNYCKVPHQEWNVPPLIPDHALKTLDLSYQRGHHPTRTEYGTSYGVSFSAARSQGTRWILGLMTTLFIAG
jgi:hypothetical protein